MLNIPVGDLLSSYSGDSKSFSFSGEIYDGYMEDIGFLTPLEFSIEIIALDDGVSVVFHDLSTSVLYEEKKYEIKISEIDREYKVARDPLDPDDIQEIRGGSIDLAPVIREEIIMACHSL